MWARALVAVAILAAHAHAGVPVTESCAAECRIETIRGMLERGDHQGARRELIALYDQTQRPELLFALGQVELQLGDYQAAIGYYERFIASKPSEDQIALAQQAIGAARMNITQPKPKQSRYEHRWNTVDTVIVVAGAATIVAGGGLAFHAYQLGSDAGGTLADYDNRVSSARRQRIAGASATAAGALAIGFAIARWRLDRTEVTVGPTPHGATVTVARRW